jgi:hypothetical protein
MSSDIRNLGYIAWKNDLSWLEKESNLKSLVHDENKQFRDTLHPIKPLIKKMESELKDEGLVYRLGDWEIECDLFSKEKIWTHTSGFKCKCWDADFSEDLFVAAVQPEGFERYTVEIYSLDFPVTKKPSLLHTIPHAGPQVAILDGEVYFLKSEKDLRYSSLHNLKGEIYHSENLEENLELKRGEDGSVYLVRGDYTKKKYALVNKKIKWLKEPHLKSAISADSLPHINKKYNIESFSIKAGWTITIDHGIRTLWKGSDSIIWIWGDISYDSRNPFRLDICDIRYEPYTIMLPEWKLTNPKALPFPCGYYNNPLPVFVVHPHPGPKGPKGQNEPKGLLITAYGAYGLSTQVGSLIQRWKPLLLRGWIIAAVMVPGSGDHDTKWIRSGQRLNRIHAIEKFTQSVRSLQEEHGILPRDTALYGRSAGGLLVSSVAIRTPGLVGSLYVESPYIDILRTMTNPELPLTTLETSEYGTSPADLIATAEWSPLEHIPEEGIPDLFVIARTDLQDLEVLPYEVLKFIKRLRGPLETENKNKLVYIHSDRGHFTTDIKSRAEDLALLESSGARIKNMDPKYKMPMTRKNRTRKNRDRKNRDRKNKNNTMMGGRRRRGRTGRKH